MISQCVHFIISKVREKRGPFNRVMCKLNRALDNENEATATTTTTIEYTNDRVTITAITIIRSEALHFDSRKFEEHINNSKKRDERKET